MSTRTTTIHFFFSKTLPPYTFKNLFIDIKLPSAPIPAPIDMNIIVISANIATGGTKIIEIIEYSLSLTL